MFDSDEYEKRNIMKQQLQKQERKCITKKGQIWMYAVGINIGGEIGKRSPFLRPCVILNAYMGSDLVLIIPCTSQKKGGKRNKPLTNGQIYGLHKDTFLISNQIRTISKKRLIYKCNDKHDNGRKIPLIPYSILQNLQEYALEK